MYMASRLILRISKEITWGSDNKKQGGLTMGFLTGFRQVRLDAEICFIDRKVD